MDELLEAQHIGSSAMPYKRSLMRSERVYGLSRELKSKPASFAKKRSDQ